MSTQVSEWRHRKAPRAKPARTPHQHPSEAARHSSLLLKVIIASNSTTPWRPYREGTAQPEQLVGLGVVRVLAGLLPSLPGSWLLAQDGDLKRRRGREQPRTGKHQNPQLLCSAPRARRAPPRGLTRSRGAWRTVRILQGFPVLAHHDEGPGTQQHEGERALLQ